MSQDNPLQSNLPSLRCLDLGFFFVVLIYGLQKYFVMKIRGICIVMWEGTVKDTVHIFCIVDREIETT